MGTFLCPCSTALLAGNNANHNGCTNNVKPTLGRWASLLAMSGLDLSHGPGLASATAGKGSLVKSSICAYIDQNTSVTMLSNLVTSFSILCYVLKKKKTADFFRSEVMADI